MTVALESLAQFIAQHHVASEAFLDAWFELRRIGALVPQYVTDAFGNIMPTGSGPSMTSQGDIIAPDGTITPAASLLLSSLSLPWWTWAAFGIGAIIVINGLVRYADRR